MLPDLRKLKSLLNLITKSKKSYILAFSRFHSVSWLCPQKKGTVYPEMENISKHFNEVLQEHAIPEEQQVAKQQQLEEFVEGGESEIEEELEEEPEDMEDMEYFDEDEVMDDDDLDDEEAEKTPTKRASDRKSQSADEEPQPSPAKRRSALVIAVKTNWIYRSHTI